MHPTCDSLTSVVSSPRADVRCETRPDVDGGNAMAEKDKTRGWARVKTLPSLPVFWVCLEAALIILWFDFAYRMTPGPVYTLPISILNHPRGDAGWLAALAGTALAAFVAMPPLARELRQAGRVASAPPLAERFTLTC